MRANHGQSEILENEASVLCSPMTLLIAWLALLFILIAASPAAA